MAMNAPILALDKVSKRFGAIIVAEDIDLTLAEGESLGIIGPNGAGKTTLFGIVSGTVAPDSGRVLYAGRDITQASPAQPGFWSQVQQGYANRICTSLPSSLRIA